MIHSRSGFFPLRPSAAIPVLLVSVLVLGSAVRAAAEGRAQPGDKSMTVTNGKLIEIEYTLKLEDKSTVDSNVGGDPLQFVQGEHQIIPGLESALDGMAVGTSKHVVVKPEEGYGPVDPKAIKEVEKSKIPPTGLKVGSELQGRDPDGRSVYAKVKEIKESTVVLDFNHPLAGQKLLFDVKVLKVLDPPAPDHSKSPE